MNALLLIDLQVDFLSTSGQLPVGETAANKVILVSNTMAKIYEDRGWPIIIIFNQFKKSDYIGNFFRKHAALEGSEGGRIDPRVIVSYARHFSKSKSSAFSNPDFAEYLIENGIKHVALCGVYAEGCVRATALDALRMSLDTVVLSDGVASNRSCKYHWAISSLRKSGVRIMSSAEFIVLQPGH